MKDFDWSFWLVIILFIFAMIISIWHFIGDSPTANQLIVAWLVVLSGSISHLNKRISNVERRFEKRFSEFEQRLHDKLTELERNLGDKIDKKP